MKIPKYITHSALFLLATTIALYILWLDSPSASDIKTSKIQSDPVLAQYDAANKQKVLKQINLFQIEDITKDGYLLIPELNGKFKINDQRFHSISPQKLKHLQGFFVGKFIKLKNIASNMQIELPAELYNPLCFANDDQQRALSNQCPVILKP